MSVFVDRRQTMYPNGFFCGVIRLKQLAGVILGRLDSNTRQLLSALIGLVFGNCCYLWTLKSCKGTNHFNLFLFTGLALSENTLK